MTFADCPTCGAEVTWLAVQRTNRATTPAMTWASWSVTTLTDPDRYVLHPCGHEMRGFVQVAPGNIKEWRP